MTLIFNLQQSRIDIKNKIISARLKNNSLFIIKKFFLHFCTTIKNNWAKGISVSIKVFNKDYRFRPF